MTTLEERYQQGMKMRDTLAGGDLTHYVLPGVDVLAPDLKRIIDESLFGAIWSREGLDLRLRCVATLSALMALGNLTLLRRTIQRCLNVGLEPSQVVEVFIQMTFYVGVPAVEEAMNLTKEIFEERGIRYTPTRAYDTQRTTDELYDEGIRVHEEYIADITAYRTDEPDSQENQLDRIINEYHWGAIHNRPHLDKKARVICSLASMTVLGQYDRQLRARIESALRIGMTPQEIMEVFIQLTMYGGYFNTRTAMRVARSVFVEQGRAGG